MGEIFFFKQDFPCKNREKFFLFLSWDSLNVVKLSPKLVAWGKCGIYAKILTQFGFFVFC
jgi:hypothetical protein